MTAMLEITDGTTTVSLLNGEFGYYLSEWEPRIAQMKAGGRWQSSPLADSRTLVTGQFSNVIETFRLKLAGVDQDTAIRATQDLRRLLEKAKAYTLTDWQGTPVYIKTQATCETYPRYARIHSWNTPNDENPFNQPFLQRLRRTVMDNWTLLVERDPFWTSNVPGTGTATAIGATESYDGRTLGQEATTTANAAFVANKRNVANLTDIYGEDGGVFGPNLLDAALPFYLFPAGPVVDDAINFGIDTTVTNSGPFCSLVFDLSVVQNDLTVIWEYVTGCGPIAWSPLTVQDNTAQFQVLGINSVHWEQESDWIECDVNGVTGYWVRARVSAIGAAPSPPEQQSRNIYSITWPYVEVASTQVGGDVAAAMRTLIYNESLDAASPAFTGGDFDRVIFGLRSTSRGAGFTSILNIANEQNPVGVTVTPTAPDTTIAADVQTATGWKATYAPGAVRTLAPECLIVLSDPLLSDFYGKFHFYLRCEQTAGSDFDISTKLIIGAGASTSVPINYESDVVFIPDTDRTLLIDLGTADIPGGVEPGDAFSYLSFVIYLATIDAAAVLDLFELVLIPVDEWAGDYSQAISGGPGALNITVGQYLDVDGLVIPKKTWRALRRLVIDDGVTVAYRPISNGPPRLQANTTQRLWFVSTALYSVSRGLRQSVPYAGHSIVVSRNQNYFSMRGDR